MSEEGKVWLFFKCFIHASILRKASWNNEDANINADTWDFFTKTQSNWSLFAFDFFSLVSEIFSCFIKGKICQFVSFINFHYCLNKTQKLHRFWRTTKGTCGANKNWMNTSLYRSLILSRIYKNVPFLPRYHESK